MLNPAKLVNQLRSRDIEAWKRLAQLANLKPGWDGSGGNPPTKPSLELAAQLWLQILGATRGSLKRPFFAPLPEGGVELEWKLDSGNELILVISPDGNTTSFLLVESAGAGQEVEHEGRLPEDATLEDLVEKLTA